MDYPKLQGIVEAMEAEWTQPGPSHANLARLCIAGFKTILENEPKTYPEDPKPLYDKPYIDETPKKQRKSAKKQ